jgi:hypothetical protein
VPSPQAPTPAFTGLVAHYDPRFQFSLFVPDGWLRLDVQDGVGVFYAPDPADPLTGLAIAARELGTITRASDMPALRRGFLAGLRQLPGCRIELREAEAVGTLITLEARHTFLDLDGGWVRQRWLRLLYQDRVQVRLIGQAASVEQFAYWEPMFYTAMRSVRFGDLRSV